MAETIGFLLMTVGFVVWANWPGYRKKMEDRNADRRNRDANRD